MLYSYFMDISTAVIVILYLLFLLLNLLQFSKLLIIIIIIIIIIIMLIMLFPFFLSTIWSPGLIYKGLCRREIEDQLIAILHAVHITSLQTQQSQQSSSSTSSLQITQESLSSQSSSSSFSFIIDDNLIKSVLKASSSLIMNTNLKPTWISSPFSYHYKIYNINMQTRPFYNISFFWIS